MKRAKLESVLPLSRLRLIQFLMGILFLYLLFMSFEIPFVFKSDTGSVGFFADTLPKHVLLENEAEELYTASRPSKDTSASTYQTFSRAPERRMREFKRVSGLFFNESALDDSESNIDEFSVLHKIAKDAWSVGKKVWDELESAETISKTQIEPNKTKSESCPHSISLSGSDFVNRSHLMVLPCGLTLGSHVTVVVDGKVKCEKWIRDDDEHSEESKAAWWLNRLIGRTKKVTVEWPYPFSEGNLFVLTIAAGLEGYHITVDGRHVTSFPYRTGFALEDATGLSVNGNVDLHFLFAASLPTSHPSFAPQKHLEMLTKWRAPPLPDGHVELFIGILSAGNHFAERMAVRKSWMQHKLITSSKVVARFFVALHGRKEVNLDLKKEAEYFGDIVIVPYMDAYDLVVLKTVAICEYGVRTVAANYIMKCDDDTFIRVDAVMKEARKVREDKSLYIGNMNYYHRPLRHGKWAVTYEEWPEEEYPPYANGPGYIVSSDIAQFIVADFEKHKLRLFKMEDVSMGMWVEKFNNSKPVEYVHSLKFCQFGCIEDYYTAHYQSPRQMVCMWDKLQNQGKPQCCNMR
ncbi:hypothetical protein CUMW_022670 [Citrus unshiu]|nr:hypothetical protein CUMW_022670 [Citrus unshiu]